MSFFSAIGGAFKVIGHGIDKATDVIDPLAPLLGMVPGFGGPFAVIYGSVKRIEELASKDAASKDKQQAAVGMVRLAYPQLDAATVATETDNLVGILNRLAKAMDAAAKEKEMAKQ